MSSAVPPDVPSDVPSNASSQALTFASPAHLLPGAGLCLRCSCVRDRAADPSVVVHNRVAAGAALALLLLYLVVAFSAYIGLTALWGYAPFDAAAVHSLASAVWAVRETSFVVCVCVCVFPTYFWWSCNDAV